MARGIDNVQTHIADREFKEVRSQCVLLVFLLGFGIADTGAIRRIAMTTRCFGSVGERIDNGRLATTSVSEESNVPQIVDVVRYNGFLDT